ncbi:MAG: alpha/beta hydrolase [Cyanobacteria bacterium J06641_5]
MNGIANAIAIASGFCVLVGGLLYASQRKLLYPAPSAEVPEDLPVNVEKIALPAGYGLLVKPRHASQTPMPLLIHAHGNAELAFWSMQRFDELLTRGFAVLLVEYPGYGGAAGKPSYESIRQAILSAYDEMVARPDIDSESIIAYGRSLGSGAVSVLVSERNLAALCLESAFSSLPLLVKEKGLPSFLLKDRFDNEAVVRSLDIPIFLYHGTQDTLIPIAHSEALAAAGKNVTFVRAHCGHNDCPRPWPELIGFLDTIVPAVER